MQIIESPVTGMIFKMLPLRLLSCSTDLSFENSTHPGHDDRVVDDSLKNRNDADDDNDDYDDDKEDDDADADSDDL